MIQRRVYRFRKECSMKHRSFGSQFVGVKAKENGIDQPN